ncbi:unnamed protein product, partial [Symbiodinium microadriaticum]
DRFGDQEPRFRQRGQVELHQRLPRQQASNHPRVAKPEDAGCEGCERGGRDGHPRPEKCLAWRLLAAA